MRGERGVKNVLFISLVLIFILKSTLSAENTWPELTNELWENITPQQIQEYIDSGAEVNARAKYGWTPLMNAAEYTDNPEVITMLLEAGADVTARANFGWTPLMVAARYTDNPEVITVLLEAGADGTLTSDEGKTAFNYAEENDHLKNTKQYWKLNDAQY